MTYVIQTTASGCNYVTKNGTSTILPYVESDCCSCKHFDAFCDGQECCPVEIWREHSIRPYKDVCNCLFDTNAAADAVVAACVIKHCSQEAKLTKKLYESGACCFHDLLCQLDNRCWKVLRLDSFEDIAVAVQKNYVCVSGIAVGGNFIGSALRGNGIAELPDVVVGNRPVVISGLENVDGQWVLKACPGWGNSWGKDGFCRLLKAHWNEGYGCRFEAFALTDVNTPEKCKKSGNNKEKHDVNGIVEAYDDHVVS